MNGPTVTLVVLAKAPVPGLAKTRLTPPYTEHQAAALAAAALLDTLDAVHAAHRVLGGPTPVVAITGDLGRCAAPGAVRSALARCTVIEQRGSGLAGRICAAHADAVGSSGPTGTLQVGMDTPQLTATMLVDAAVRLNERGGPAAILGPATDGGWWALGLRDPTRAGLVIGVPMSTPFTFERTRQALRRGGIESVRLATLTDVDDAASCAAVAAIAPRTRFGELVATIGEPVGPRS